MREEYKNLPKQYDISIIMVQYNPDLKKIYATLNSIIQQENINFELIIADDGSINDYFSEIKMFFLNNKFNNYQLIKNEKNLGTVGNMLSGVRAASGTYIKGISPGDLFYNDMVLSYIVSFMKEKKAKAAFGDAIYYSYNDKKFQIYKVCNPADNYIYKEKKYNFERVEINQILCQDLILGASMIFFRSLFQECLEILNGKVRYIEDSTMIMICVMKYQIYHIKEYILWYEYGTGISTSKNDRWKEIVDKDFDNFLDLMIDLFPDNLKFQKCKKLRKVSLIENSKLVNGFLKFKMCPERTFNLALIKYNKLRNKIKKINIDKKKGLGIFKKQENEL